MKAPKEFVLRSDIGAYRRILQSPVEGSRMSVAGNRSVGVVREVEDGVLVQRMWLGCSEGFQSRITMEDRIRILFVSDNISLDKTLKVLRLLAGCFGVNRVQAAKRDGYMVVYPGRLKNSLIFWSLFGQLYKDFATFEAVAVLNELSLEALFTLPQVTSVAVLLTRAISSYSASASPAKLAEYVKDGVFSHPLFTSLAEVDWTKQHADKTIGGVPLIPGGGSINGFWTYTAVFHDYMKKGILPK